MRRTIALLSTLIFVAMIQTLGADTQPIGVCPTLIRDALERVEQICAGTGRNQVCYANSQTEAEPQSFITDFSFELGDITDLTNIRRLRLSGMNTETDEWGMALMRVQASLPDTLPGQNVLFLLFGDVELDPEPSLQLVSTVSNVTREPTGAFRLRSAIGAPLCDSAPPDGLLIQTPHGLGRVELTLNGVDLSLGSTVFFRAQENRSLTVSTLEGSVLLSTPDGESLVLAGTEVQIPLGENLEPSGPPLLPQPYDAAELTRLPLDALERAVEIHPPLSPEEVLVVQQAVLDGEACALLSEATNPIAHQPPPNCAGTQRVTRTARGGNNSINDNGGANGNGNSSDGAQPSNPPPADTGGNGNGGNNPNGNGGDCPGNSCNSNGAAGSGGNGGR